VLIGGRGGGECGGSVRRFNDEGNNFADDDAFH
jgi:hypothetical protein